MFENVAGLVTMDGGSRPEIDREGQDRDDKKMKMFKAGRTFETVLQAFRECGYEVSWRVLNARHWVAQTRERVYMVGIRSDL